jgi:hypothetical protein
MFVPADYYYKQQEKICFHLPLSTFESAKQEEERR